MIVHIWTKYCSVVQYTFVSHIKNKMRLVVSNEEQRDGMKIMSATVNVDFCVKWMSLKGNSSIRFSISKSTQGFGKLFYDISTEMKDTWSFYCLCFSRTKYILSSPLFWQILALLHSTAVQYNYTQFGSHWWHDNEEDHFAIDNNLSFRSKYSTDKKLYKTFKIHLHTCYMQYIHLQDS